MDDSYPDIFNDSNWLEAARHSTPEQLQSLALPGPPLTHEQLLQAIREGDESGIYEGDPFADIRAARARRLGNAAA